MNICSGIKAQKPNVLQTTRCPSNNPGGLERCVSGKWGRGKTWTSFRKKPTRIVHHPLFLLFNVISKTSEKLVQLVQATFQCHNCHVSKKNKFTCQAHVTETTLQQHCIMFEFECQRRNSHKKREKHFLI